MGKNQKPQKIHTQHLHRRHMTITDSRDRSNGLVTTINSRSTVYTFAPKNNLKTQKHTLYALAKNWLRHHVKNRAAVLGFFSRRSSSCQLAQNMKPQIRHFRCSSEFLKRRHSRQAEVRRRRLKESHFQFPHCRLGICGHYAIALDFQVHKSFLTRTNVKDCVQSAD